jgi:hypothetical protein
MNFSLTDGKPIAMFKDKSGENKVLYVNDKKTDGSKHLTDKEITAIIENFIDSETGRISMLQVNQIYQSLKSRTPPENKKLLGLYNDLLLNNIKDKIITIENGSMMPMFDPNEERKVYYIAGMSGSGKSTFVSDVIGQYIKLYPKNNVFLFSNKPSDPVLDKHKKLIRIKLDDELIEEPLDLDELKHSLVIFDDVEYSPNKNIGLELDRIRDLILQQGRSYKISFCYITHQLSNYKHSRIILNECHSIVLFPKMTTMYSLKYLLERYFGFQKNDILKLKTLNSRWVCINKIPPCVIYSNGAYFVE